MKFMDVIILVFVVTLVGYVSYIMGGRVSTERLRIEFTRGEYHMLNFIVKDFKKRGISIDVQFNENRK